MLRICELTLAGFGVYERPTRFLLPTDGSAIFWGANETGKTTFLWGVAAVWFGLPKSSDSSKIGTERFYSFGRPGAFWGEIVWEYESQRFRLHRDFDLQSVRLVEETSEGEHILFVGEHNPQGRSSKGSAFTTHLRERLGLAQLDLYLETFCITQPMPGDDAIGQELQHLISGSRATKIDDVLTHVWMQVKDLTRLTGDLGIARPGTSRPTNQRDPGKIERIETAIAQSRLDERLARTQLERLNEGNQALQSAQEEAETIRRRQADRKGRLGALDRWTTENKARVRRTERLQQLDHTLEEYDRLRAQQKALETALGNEFASFKDAPENLTLLLESVEDAAESNNRLMAQHEVWLQKKDERETEAATLEEDLSSKFAQVRGRGDWVDTRRKLLEAVARQETQRAELVELGTSVSRRTHDLEASETMDAVAVDACEAHAGLLTESFRRIQRIETKLASLDGQLEEREFLGAEGRLTKLREKIELEHELRESSILIREKRAAALEARFQKAEDSEDPDPENPDPDDPNENSAATAAEENPVDEGDAQKQTHATRKTWPFGLLAASAIAVALHFGLAWAWSVAGSIGGSLFLIWFVIDRKRAPRGKSNPLREEITPGRRLRKRLHETKPEITTDIDGTGIKPPDLAAAEELRALQDRQRAIEKILGEMRDILGPYATTNQSQLAAMEERWRIVIEQVEGLHTERAELLESRFGADDDDSWQNLPVAESDEYLERLLQLPGGPAPDENPSVLDLLQWLESLNEQDWAAFKDAETARGQALSELESLRQRQEKLEAEVSGPSEIERLETKLAPFTLETNPKELLRLTEDCQDAERRLQSLKDRIAEFSEETFTERLRDGNATIEAAWSALASNFDCERPADEQIATWAKRTREEAGPARDAQKRLAQLDDSSETLLRSALFKSRDELIDDRTSESAALGQIVRELSHLEESELALATDENDPSADRATRLGQLRETEERAARADTQSAETAEEEVRRLLRGMASLEGEDIPNLASLEIELHRREEELAEAVRDRDALVMAFRWMDEAAETFQGTYRETLEHKITRHFQDLTDGDRSIEVTEKFEIVVRNADGLELCVEQLSQGTRDQLVLSIRLGVSDLLSGSVPLPFFFDDAFVHFDEARLVLAKQTLDALGRQWILLTHRRDLSGWADPVFTCGPEDESGEKTAADPNAGEPMIGAKAESGGGGHKAAEKPSLPSTGRSRRRRRKKQGTPVQSQGNLNLPGPDEV